MKTNKGLREFKLHFEKSKMSFGIMAPIGSTETEQVKGSETEETKLVTKYDFVNFSNIKGGIIEEKNFKVKDKSNKTVILDNVVNLDRLPRARFTLKEDDYGKIKQPILNTNS